MSECERSFGDSTLPPSVALLHRGPDLDALEDAAERLLTLPGSEGPRAERAAVAALHELVAGSLVNNPAFAASVLADVTHAAGRLQALLAGILREARPVEEHEFLRVIRLLAAIGCWGPSNSAERGGDAAKDSSHRR